MIIGIGIDIVEVDRIKKAAQRWGNDFLKRIFTKKELSYSKERKSMYQHLAARFAVKEALTKAFGNGKLYSLDWREVEVSNNIYGRPSVRLYGKANRLKKKRGVKDILISISHTKDYAVANVLLMKE